MYAYEKAACVQATQSEKACDSYGQTRRTKRLVRRLKIRHEDLLVIQPKSSWKHGTIAYQTKACVSLTKNETV